MDGEQHIIGTAKMERTLRNDNNNVDNTVTKNKLARLGAQAIVKLLTTWLDTHAFNDSQLVSDNLVELVKKHGVRNIANMAVTRWWPSLSREQLSQLDIWSVLCDTSNNQWVASRCLDRDGKQFIVNVEPNELINGMHEQFKRLYELDVSIEENDDLRMYICRVQLFESTGDLIINTHKPFYFAIMPGHSIIFHSLQNDTHSQLILLAFSKLHSKTITLERISRKPTTSLRELNLSLGLPSVNTTGFGVWSVYSGKDALEPSPLIEPKDHPINHTLSDSLIKDQTKRRSDIAMLKFKGSMSGVRRKKIYDMKRMNDRIYGNSDANIKEITRYDSLLPVRRVKFTYADTKMEGKVQINLSGKDIFGGLHELSDKGLLDPEVMPDWLCGDYGDTSGNVEDGVFTPNPVGGLI
ncbi:Chl4 [Kluyveromyces lactis]|nr:Chl4 [Kluyveromyces lactis]